MREIRGRIAQRQGIDLSNQQIQDLAARRLESILDPRAIKPSLLEALRRSAGAQAQRAAEKVPNEPGTGARVDLLHSFSTLPSARV